MAPTDEGSKHWTLRSVRRLVSLSVPPTGFKKIGLRALAVILEARQPTFPFFSVLRERLQEDGDLTLQELMDSAGEQTYGLMVLVAGLTSFIPGISIAGGLMAMILGVEMWLGMPHPWLPERIGRIRIQRGRVKELLARFEGWLLKLGRGQRPLRPLNRKLMGAVIAWTALLLALPMPIIIPFGNVMPAIAVCILGAALLEERPLWAWLGVLAMLVTTIYLGLSFKLILHYVMKLFA